MGMGSELLYVMFFKKVVHLVPKQFQLKIHIVSTLPDLPNQKNYFFKKYMIPVPVGFLSNCNGCLSREVMPSISPKDLFWLILKINPFWNNWLNFC